MDFGGPRKEFFVLALREMKDQYFNPIREWSKDYEVLGKIMGNYVNAKTVYSAPGKCKELIHVSFGDRDEIVRSVCLAIWYIASLYVLTFPFCYIFYIKNKTKFKKIS